jgi:hypothetical protein
MDLVLNKKEMCLTHLSSIFKRTIPKNLDGTVCVCVCTHIYLCVYLYTYIYIGCPRRNVPDFARVFLMLKYTDITLNTYIHNRTVTEIMAREMCGLLAVPRTASLLLTRYVYTAHVRPSSTDSSVTLRLEYQNV